MQNIINYDDKVALYQNSDIADINKVNASDMNEIKSIVNGSLQGTNAMGSIVVDDVNCKNLFSGIMYNGIINQSGAYITNNARITNTTANGFFLPQGTYTLSIADLDACTVVIKNASGTVIQDLADSWKTLPFTFTTTQDGYICFSAKKNNDATLNPNDYAPQLEKGSTATNYTKGKHIIKEQDGYVKESTTFYANDFKCRNIFNYNSSKFGYVLGSGGAESTASGFLISDYIPVTPNTTYTISRVFNNVSGAENSMRIGYYQQDKTFIDRPASSDNPYTITTPSNCYYVRLSYQYQSQGQTSNDKVQLEIGEATPYTPYKNFENEEIYSTNEVKIGTWIDGKPLYRKVITATPNIANATTSSSFDIDIANVDQVFIKDTTKIADTSSSGYVYTFPFLTGSVTIGGYISVLTNKLTFYVRKTNNVGFYAIRLVLEYTKTTD